MVNLSYEILLTTCLTSRAAIIYASVLFLILWEYSNLDFLKKIVLFFVSNPLLVYSKA